MKAQDINLNMLRNHNNLDDSLFLDSYVQLQTGEPSSLSDDARKYLLKIAVIFIASIHDDVRRFGYRIILSYVNRFQDYQPLHDVAHLFEYIPVVNYLDKRHGYSDDNLNEGASASHLLMTAYKENFLLPVADGIYRSAGQMRLSHFASDNDDMVVVAPTSYGKSDLIISKAATHPDSNICIVVPSKALLAQTKKALLKNDEIRTNRPKIITHPDMYRTGDRILAVLTQERMLRLLQKNSQLKFDFVLVDEAHNILSSDHRAKLLAQVLMICKKRNSALNTNFYTPFIASPESIKLVNEQDDKQHFSIDEHIKIERLYYATIDPLGGDSFMGLYDQFLNRSLGLSSIEENNDISFIINHSQRKNIVYVNKPRDTEHAAMALARTLPDVEISPGIEQIISALADLVHDDYNMIECVKKGVVYHHGGLPDIVRLYIENIFTKSNEIQYIVTTSTLLEGVNIPAERMFILTPNKGRGHLSKAQFRNLIGRVSRFGDVFNSASNGILLLEPHIYLIKGMYCERRFNPLKFYKDNASISIKVTDKIENPLLTNTDNANERIKAFEYLENIEPGSSGTQLDFRLATTNIGKYSYKNNVHDFDIVANEEQLNANLMQYTSANSVPISSAEQVMQAILAIFIQDVNLHNSSDAIERIARNEKAQRFYSRLLQWRTEGAAFKKMIALFVHYWRSMESNLVYIGSRWGEETSGTGVMPLWVDMRKKTPAQLVNLAIAKIKEEQDFVEFNLLQYIEVLNDLELVDSTLYDQIKYGTSDVRMITLLKNGCSLELSKLIVEHDEYYNQLIINVETDEVQFTDAIVEQMRSNDENAILMFEASSYVR
jgi:hypothetical protein